MKDKTKTYTCLLCGRDKFSRPGEPHGCVGGFRKRFKAAAKAKGIPDCFVETIMRTSFEDTMMDIHMERTVCEAIAIASGWEKGPKRDLPCGPFVILAMTKWHRISDGEGYGWQDEPPRYTRSLDAMREAEETLGDVNRRGYSRFLEEFAPKDEYTEDFEVIHATAFQRATAFLKVVRAEDGCRRSAARMKAGGARRCGACGHARGFRRNLVRLGKWLCECECHRTESKG